MEQPKNPRIKLEGEAHKRMRLYILSRDKKCLGCGRSNVPLTPYAHMLTRRAQGGHDSPDNLGTLCQSTTGRKGCHEKFDQYEMTLEQQVWEMLSREPVLVHGTKAELLEQVKGLLHDE